MRKYFVKYWANFGNTYNLAYTDTDAQAAEAEANGWERITRKQAESKCADENRARQADPAFSGYGDNMIYPYGYDCDWRDDRHAEKNGYIIELSK